MAVVLDQAGSAVLDQAMAEILDQLGAPPATGSLAHTVTRF
jgi:hypothetical protein